MSAHPWAAVERFAQDHPGTLTGAEYGAGGVIALEWRGGRRTTVTPNGPDGIEYRADTRIITADEWPEFLADMRDQMGRDTPSA